MDELLTVVFEMLKNNEETQGNEETRKAATSLINGSVSINLDSSHPISLPLSQKVLEKKVRGGDLGPSPPIWLKRKQGKTNWDRNLNQSVFDSPSELHAPTRPVSLMWQFLHLFRILCSCQNQHVDLGRHTAVNGFQCCQWLSLSVGRTRVTHLQNVQISLLLYFLL